MKKLLLVAVAGMLLVSVSAGAAVQNMAIGFYKNMAGTPFPETVTLTVTANLIGPNITLMKSQTNMRTSQTGPTIMIASGDTIQYQVQFSNTGSDSAMDLSITDTLSFDTVPGQTVYYIQGSINPDSGNLIAGGQVKMLEWFDGGGWNPGNSGSIPQNTKGIRWIISVVNPGGPYNVNYQIRVTSP